MDNERQNTNRSHREHQVQTPNTTTEASTDREPHDSIRKVNSTSKGTTGDNDIAQNNTRRPGGATACEESD